MEGAISLPPLLSSEISTCEGQVLVMLLVIQKELRSKGMNGRSCVRRREKGGGEGVMIGGGWERLNHDF